MMSQQIRRMRGNKGFTLIELLVAITILGLVVVPLLSAFITGGKTVTKSRKLGEANALAQSIGEYLQNNGIDALIDNATITPTAAGASTVTKFADLTEDGKKGFTVSLSNAQLKALDNQFKTPEGYQVELSFTSDTAALNNNDYVQNMRTDATYFTTRENDLLNMAKDTDWKFDGTATITLTINGNGNTITSKAEYSASTKRDSETKTVRAYESTVFTVSQSNLKYDTAKTDANWEPPSLYFGYWPHDGLSGVNITVVIENFDTGGKPPFNLFIVEQGDPQVSVSPSPASGATVPCPLSLKINNKSYNSGQPGVYTNAKTQNPYSPTNKKLYELGGALISGDREFAHEDAILTMDRSARAYEVTVKVKDEKGNAINGIDYDYKVFKVQQ